MFIYIAVALVAALCVFITGVYGYFTYIKYRQRRLWDSIYAHLKIKYGLLTDLLVVVKDVYPRESEMLGVLAGCLNAFILSKTPADAAAAYAKTHAALTVLDDTLKNHILLLDNDAYQTIKDEMIKTDEKINFTARFYDDSAMKFNARLRFLPFKAVAGIFNIGAKSRLNFFNP